MGIPLDGCAVLVEHAPARGYQKRGGGAERVFLEKVRLVAAERPRDMTRFRTHSEANNLSRKTLTADAYG
jgi:hypothetical protein